jgi:outer membrane receptor protein involved in Fe transport
MKKLILTIVSIVFLLATAMSQIPSSTKPGTEVPLAPRSGVVKGKIVEKGSNVALEYANVAIYKSADSSLVSGSIANDLGTFKLTGLDQGEYYVEVKFIGYDKLSLNNISVTKNQMQVDLGEIQLAPSSENIKEVKVVAQNKAIAYEIDKKVIDPSQFPTSANGTAVDVLANSPSVSVDIEGNVSLRGSSNFTVLIDGRPTPFTAADALEQIPASTIRNIEVITNPSAKFDPDGNSGIININTKKSKLMGFSGIANANADSYGSLSGDFLLNFKKGKFNFFVGGNRSNNKGGGESESINKTFGADTITTTSIGKSDREFNAWSIKAGVDYFINDKNTLSLSANTNNRSRMNGGTSDYTESSTNGLFLNTLTKDSSIGSGDNYSVNLDYKRTFNKPGEELTAYLRYQQGENEDYTYYNRYLNGNEFYNGQKNWEIGNEDEVRFKLDYVLPLSEKMKIETGYQARLDRDFEWNDVYRYSIIDDYKPSKASADYTDSDFSRDIHSLYATWSNSTKGVGYQLGLRTEYTDRSITYSGANEVYGINRWDFFPTIHISFNLSESHQFTTSYTRRIQRPRSHFLEPFTTHVDAYNIRKGNPALEPEYIDSYEAGYQLQLAEGFISAEIYHRKTNNKIEPIMSVYSENVMLQTFANIGSDYSTGVEAIFNYNPTKWWMINIMGNVYQYRINGELYGGNVDQSSTNWNTRINNTFTITKTTKLQIDGMYNSPTTSAQGRREGFAFSNLAVRQDLFNNKLNLTFSVRDVLNTAKFGFESNGPGFYSKSKFDMRSPVFALSVSYKINNYKQKRPQNGENGENRNEVEGASDMMDMGGMGGME